MKKPFSSLILTLLAVLPVIGLLLPASHLANAADAAARKSQWKKVKEAVDKGLPKTAIEHLDPIIAGALDDKAYAEAIKAIGQKITLEGNIQGNKPEEKVRRLQAEMDKAPAEMKPVMEAILAHWYWQYFQHNRWRFIQRTQTDAPPGDDFTTWDLPRILGEIDKHFTAALSAQATLQQTPIAEYDLLLSKGNVPDAYRPTLYDFLAHEALAFYSAGEQAGARSQDAFDLSAEEPIFAAAEAFLQWEIETTDQRSPTVKALGLYQDLLRFHQQDEDRSAWIDVDLLRLNFGSNKAFGEEKNARYKAALRRFDEKWTDHPISSRARHDWATVLQQEGELVEAHQVATEGMNRFPDSVGGKRCFNLVQQIEARSVQITTERVWNKPPPTIDVHYKNITKVYFRAVSYDWEARLKQLPQQRPEQLDQQQRTALLTKRPTHAWSADLPATTDYQQRVESIAIPQNLAPGLYFLISSHDQTFRDENNQVMFTDIWVSDLALVMRTRHGQNILEGFVLDAISGEPIADARLTAWTGDRNQWVPVPPTKSDEHGLFRFTGDHRKNYLVHASKNGQELVTGNNYRVDRRDLRAKPFSRTIFFTDRGLYRPGQTIQYKGLCVQIHQEKDNYKTLADESLTVIFADGNGKEISRQQHWTNDYGSFHGSVTAPRDRLMGQMSIHVDGEPSGSASFNVEEYKRPKFEVALEPPQEAARLNTETSLVGKATAYTGAAIGGAKVQYRVVREVRYPNWWQWCFWWRTPQTNSQEIVHGSTTTGSDGRFTIKFTPTPDRSVSAEDEPTFQFTVYADVTDTSGETRSAQHTVSVGYTALQASLSATDWQEVDKSVEVTLHTTTLDGEGQPSEGSLKVYRLKQPEKVQRPSWQIQHYTPRRLGTAGEPAPDPANPNSWPLGEVVAEQGYTTDAEGRASFSFDLPAGPYRTMLTTQDRFGKPVTARLPLTVLDPGARKLELKVPHLFSAPSWNLEPGQEFTALWGSGYEQARAYVEVEHRRRLLKSYWTEPGRTQEIIGQDVTEAMRGGFTVRVTMVRENRAYLESRHVNVPWSNKNLTIKWEHFTSKLEPAAKETWTAIITGPKARQVVAEMVACMYDASLDAYLMHQWQQSFGVFRYDRSNLASRFENQLKGFQHLHGNWPIHAKNAQLTYRSFPADIIANLWGYQFRRMAHGMANGAAKFAFAAEAPAARELEVANQSLGIEAQAASSVADEGTQPPGPDLSQVSARKNLNETAFFFPHLISDKQGRVKLEFTMPEALTQWKFMGFAHDEKLRSGFLQDEVVTAKDLMVEPNPPRFVREDDVLEFSVKVSNQSASRQKGKVRLTLADARTLDSADTVLGNLETDRDFDIASQESQSYSWQLKVPDGTSFLTYKAVGSTGRLSDGEEGYLPVLSRRMLVTESLPLPIRGAQTKKFDFARLRESGESSTLRHENLSVQMVSNPSWYAVMALPYLMEYPHQCTEQVFNRLYANALARHIANSDPKIRRVFDIWKNTPGDTLDSPLEKNQDLKAVMLEETPWLRQAHKESQARRNVGILFDENRLNDETARLLRKLAELQLPDGAWSWFPGGPSNDYITLYITTGFGRMRHLGVDLDVSSAIKSLDRLDAWIDRIYREILEHGDKKANHLSTTIAFYLYGRSFFIEDKPIAANHKEAVDYFLEQAKTYWLELAHRQSQAHLAVALKRFGNEPTARGIMRSIKERSVSDDELGMFWRELELSWWWYRAPIETQAMMIEAFDEVMNDADAVEECKVWLLKQKQTQDWKTTKATADAVYALLLRGSDLLASQALVEVSLGGERIELKNVEAGTGFYEQRFLRGEIKPEFGEVLVKKVDEGVAWGSVHWQYLEDMSQLTPYEGTPLKLKKSLYTKTYTKQGPVLTRIQGELKVGDELVVRVELRVDRDMEYVHLKDQRGSGTEPVNVLSRYRYQDGLAYYESTRDTASHFFIDYLPKGVYVFEYSTRVVHRGRYQTGMAQVQCMYALEFNSHSESFLLDVN